MREYTLFGGVNGQVFKFEIESGLIAEQQLDAQAHGTFCDPCNDFFGCDRGCPRVRRCPWRHFRSGTKPLLVCKHYRNELCKKDELTCREPRGQRVPRVCQRFCAKGSRCLSKHTHKEACPRYLGGFCPDGPNCKFGHPSFDKPFSVKGAGVDKFGFGRNYAPAQRIVREQDGSFVSAIPTRRRR